MLLRLRISKLQVSCLTLLLPTNRERERETHFETATGEESESTRWVGFDVKPEGSAASECERLSERKPKESQGIDSRLK